jgi:hypothetical protein
MVHRTSSLDLVAFHLLVTAEAEVAASFLRRCARAIAINDGAGSDDRLVEA